MSVYTLSVYQDYACRHSGACCTAGWSIPVEPAVQPILHVDLLVPNADGSCVHFDRESRRCGVQRDHGEEMLPRSCFQFPRRALLDDRGTFVTLSNFCPTAATLLCESEAPLAIVNRPRAFPESREYDGLDARGQWAPLLRPDVLFDLPSYSRWEQFLVSAFAADERVDDVLVRIIQAAETLRAWSLKRGPFETYAALALTGAGTATPMAAPLPRRYQRYRRLDVYDTLRRFVPRELAPPAAAPLDMAPTRTWDADGRTVRRYLASKAFASWSAYEGRGVRTLIAELLVSELVLRVECERVSLAAGCALNRALLIDAIRQSDLFLVHLIDRRRMIAWLGEIEVSDGNVQ